MRDREPWPKGVALAWHARGAGFESPLDQTLCAGSFCALTSSRTTTKVLVAKWREGQQQTLSIGLFCVSIGLCSSRLN